MLRMYVMSLCMLCVCVMHMQINIKYLCKYVCRVTLRIYDMLCMYGMHVCSVRMYGMYVMYVYYVCMYVM